MRAPGLTIRPERPADVSAVYNVNERAFGQQVEADLVDALRDAGKAVVSLVAILEGRIVGHILFSSVRVEPARPALRLLGLAPMAVAPEFQRRGIGSALVRTGLERCRTLGHEGIVVLGHPDYYPRFSFAPASRFGLRSEYDVPDEVFMALELCEGGLAGCSGTVAYEPEFARV
jgi:putative acetyltransferase